MTVCEGKSRCTQPNERSLVLSPRYDSKVQDPLIQGVLSYFDPICKAPVQGFIGGLFAVTWRPAGAPCPPCPLCTPRGCTSQIHLFGPRCAACPGAALCTVHPLLLASLPRPPPCRPALAHLDHTEGEPMNTSALVLQLARYQTARAVNYMAPQHPAYPPAPTYCARAKETRAMTMTITTAVDVTAELGRSQAAEACRVSLDTIKRRLKANAFPHARQVGLDRQWAIPVRDLIDAGLLPASAISPSAPALGNPEPAASHIAPVGGGAQLAEVLAESRGLRAELHACRRRDRLSAWPHIHREGCLMARPLKGYVVLRPGGRFQASVPVAAGSSERHYEMFDTKAQATAWCAMAAANPDLLHV